MITLDEFKEKTETVIAAFNSLMSIAGDEIKEKGTPEEDTVHYTNALYYAIQEACNTLNIGLEGKFPWEKEQDQ